MIRKTGFLVILILLSPGLVSASSESGIKAGVILNKSSDRFYSWIVIHETDYFIKELISIGYETQFSYYKFKSSDGSVDSENSAFPLNIFFNSKIKLMRRGIAGIYVGAGLGLLTNIVNYREEFGIEKYHAFHMMGGLSIGKRNKASFQVEIRILTSDKEDSNEKLLLVAGVKY